MTLAMKLISLLCVVGLFATISAHAEESFDPPVPGIDSAVVACLSQSGVAFLPDTDVICYNAAIFPEEFLKLNTLEPASRIIITSPGGNVATARGMSGILDRRDEPVTIAGPCMSACAMVILPGLSDVHIHRSAHIAVHGIAMMPFKRWWGWERNDAEPGALAIIQAQYGYDFKFAMYSSLTGHMRQHLTDQGIDLGFIDDISEEMEADARDFNGCRIDPTHYWGMLDREHLRTYLGDAISRMEDFAETWSDPDNQIYHTFGTSISDVTYIMQNAFEAGGCSD